MKKVALITGASSGIGYAAALHLSARGFHVLAGVRSERHELAWKNIPGATPLRIDVTQEESVTRASREAASLLESAVEVHLVNNAGIAVAGPIEGVPLARWREQFEVNVFGLVRVTQAFLPHVRRTKGRVVNISSISGLATSPYLGLYSSSKFAVEAISDALRRELRSTGVKVIVVEPGPIATPIWEKGLAKKDFLFAELPDHLHALYSAPLAKFQAGVEEAAKSAAPVAKVSAVIEKALSAPRPRTRYVVGAAGLSAQMAIFGMLPDHAVDFIVSRQLR